MAGRPKKPTNLLTLQGAFDKNPQRLGDRPPAAVLEGSIGNAPKHWTLPEGDSGFARGQELQEIWLEIIGIAPWLAPAQRMTLEDVCVLRYRARHETLKPSEQNLLRLMSNSLGLNGVGGKAPDSSGPTAPSDPRDAFERLRG